MSVRVVWATEEEAISAAQKMCENAVRTLPTLRKNKLKMD